MSSSSSILPGASTIPVPSNLSLSPPVETQSLPHPTQRALLLHLQSEPDTISKLQETLTNSLASTGWPDRVRALALELLRSGTCTTFPELYAEVLRRAKNPHPMPPAGSNNNGPQPPDSAEKKGVKGTANGPTPKKGSALPNGHVPTTVILPQGSYGADGWPDVRIPLKTVEDGVDFLKAKVKDVVEVVEPDELEEKAVSDED